MTQKLRRLFPRLFGNDYHLSSRKTRRYNCLAGAIGDTGVWWDAGAGGIWPDGVPEDGSVLAAIRFFENFGYTRAANAELEQGVLKIAIYGETKVTRTRPGN